MPPDHAQARAIAHVFVDLLSAHDPDGDRDAQGTQASLVMARLFELDAVVLEDSNHMDLTPLLGGAALAMRALLDVCETAGATEDQTISAWREAIDD